MVHTARCLPRWTYIYYNKASDFIFDVWPLIAWKLSPSPSPMAPSLGRPVRNPVHGLCWPDGERDSTVRIGSFAQPRCLTTINPEPSLWSSHFRPARVPTLFYLEGPIAGGLKLHVPSLHMCGLIHLDLHVNLGQGIDPTLRGQPQKTSVN